MPADFSTAVTALNKAAELGKTQGMDSRENAGAPGAFADMVKDVTSSAIETGEKAEKMSAAAISGDADVTDVVTAVANAEITLQTMVAVRDKIISAYQEILRMPI